MKTLKNQRFFVPQKSWISVEILFALIVMCLLVTGCTTSVKEIKDNPDNFIGKTVTVTGEATNTMKIGDLSGFTLVADDGTKIPVSSKTLPEDGSKVTVKGVVMKELLIGVYIHADKVN
jgi:RNase P/RNase MRP subunit p29